MAAPPPHGVRPGAILPPMWILAPKVVADPESRSRPAAKPVSQSTGAADCCLPRMKQDNTMPQRIRKIINKPDESVKEQLQGNTYAAVVLKKRGQSLIRTVSLIVEAGIAFWVFLQIDHWLIQQAVSLFHEEIENIPIVATLLGGIQVLSALAILLFYGIHVLRLLIFEIREEMIKL